MPPPLHSSLALPALQQVRGPHAGVLPPQLQDGGAAACHQPGPDAVQGRAATGGVARQLSWFAQVPPATRGLDRPAGPTLAPATCRSWRASCPRRYRSARRRPTRSCWSTSLCLRASGPLAAACLPTRWSTTACSFRGGGRASSRRSPSRPRWGGQGGRGRGGPAHQELPQPASQLLTAAHTARFPNCRALSSTTLWTRTARTCAWCTGALAYRSSPTSLVCGVVE